MAQLPDEYRYDTSAPSDAHSYLLPTVVPLIEKALAGKSRWVLDLGCGSGGATAFLADKGIDVVGVDPSETSIGKARRAYPALRFEVASAYDDLASTYGRFPSS